MRVERAADPPSAGFQRLIQQAQGSFILTPSVPLPPKPDSQKPKPFHNIRREDTNAQDVGVRSPGHTAGQPPPRSLVAERPERLPLMTHQRCTAERARSGERTESDAARDLSAHA